MSVTPNPNNNLDTELKQQYQGLTDDVKAYYDKQQADFLAESKSKYPDKDSFYQDRGKFLIRKKIDDLDSHRREVWTYLTSEFDRNTQDKNLNAKMMSQNKKDMLRHQKDFEKYQKKLEEASSDQHTSNRIREIELYELNRRKSQVFLMKIIALTMLACLVLTVCLQQNLLPSQTTYAVMAIFVGMILYVIFYLYFKNPGRSRRTWDKYYFEQPVEEIQKDLNLDEINYDKLDKDLDKEFLKYMDSCAAKPDKKVEKPTNLTPST